VFGTLRPIAFAVFRLSTNRKRVGCSTGRSAGLAPLKMRSTRAAERSKISRRSGLNSKNREAYHVYTKAALARLRSGSGRGTGDRNRNDRTARNDHLTPIAGSERIKYILTAGEKSVRVSRGTALNPRRPRRAALSLVHAPGPGLRLSEQGAHSPQRSAASRL
jgi:hypothetical protein